MATPDSPYIRPGFLVTRLINPVVRRTGVTTLLAVPGRRTGDLHTTPLGKPFEYVSDRYLVSGRGQTQWARNLRAAGRGELRTHGVSGPFRAVEITGTEHDRILAAYREALGRAVKGYFERIPDPADHPVFRIEPLATNTPA